jgi:hypothetical protein
MLTSSWWSIPSAFSGLDDHADLCYSIFLPTTMVFPMSTAGKDLLAWINHVGNDNINVWYCANPDTYQALVAKYQDTLPIPGSPTPILPSTTVITSKSHSDCIAIKQVCKAKVSMELLLAHQSTNADGTPIIILGILCSTFTDAMQEKEVH